MINKFKLNSPRDWAPKEKQEKSDIEIWKDKDGYFIRKGICKINCVCSRLNKVDLLKLRSKIDKILNK